MTAPAKAAPMREDVTQSTCICDHACPMTDDRHWVNCPAHAYYVAFLAHTARPDAGDDKAEIERLRGLLIDPGSPPWEDARAVLVAELRKEGLDCHADNIAAAHGIEIPSHIALNLIAQAARRPDAGDEDVERLAQFLHDEGGFGDAMTDRTWPDHPDDTGQREGGWVKIVPSDVQAQFRNVARRWLMPRATAPSPRGFSRFDPPGLWESEPRLGRVVITEAGER